MLKKILNSHSFFFARLSPGTHVIIVKNIFAKKIGPRVTGRVCGKMARNVADPIFCQNECTNFAVEKSSTKIWDTSLIVKTPLEINNCPIGKNSPIGAI
jgi:hypothetical protein